MTRAEKQALMFLVSYLTKDIQAGRMSSALKSADDIHDAIESLPTDEEKLEEKLDDWSTSVDASIDKLRQRVENIEMMLLKQNTG